MRKLLLFIAVVNLLFGCGIQTGNKSNPELCSELQELNDNQDYFKLKRIYEQRKNELSTEHALYYNAIINNVFNKPEASNRLIAELFSLPSMSLSETLCKELYFVKLQNQINLCDYIGAMQSSEVLMKDYLSLLDSVDLKETKNANQIWKALKDVPKQEVVRNADCLMPLVRDKVGLLNLETTFADTSLNFVFDTGANFSTIQKSLVKKLGLKPLEADFTITAATGNNVKTELAIAESLEIGGMSFRNVVFLVLPDEKLTFAQYDYEIKGIVGFPVIKAMEEIHISKDNKLFIPQEITEYSFNNLAIDALMPIIAGEYEGDTLRFGFDTGAASTSLYNLFFERYRQKIEKDYTKQKFTSTGAGGAKEFEGYIINDFNLKIAGTEAKLDSLKLNIQDIGIGKHLHGNFGQDYIKQFDEMIISFKYSSVVFR